MTVVDETAEHLVLDPAAANLLFREARTANTFTDEPVTDEQVAAIYDLAKWGPTSANQQPLRALVVRSPEARERLVKHMSEGNREKTRTAPVAVVLAADTNFHENFSLTFPHNAEFFTSYFAGDDAMRADTAKFNAALQIAYFIIAVRAAGLAAGPMTGFDAEGVDKEFFDGQPYRSLIVINIGKPGPNAWQDRLHRLEFDQVATIV